MEGTIGEIRLFAGDFAPQGWRFCDGSTLSEQRDYAVISVLNKQFGSSSSSNYQLPNLAPALESDGGKTPIRYVICVQGMYPLRPR